MVFLTLLEWTHDSQGEVEAEELEVEGEAGEEEDQGTDNTS